MDTPCQGLVLLVGDGDFSLTLSLMYKGSLKGAQVTTSNLDSLESIQQHKLAAGNMKVLTEMGVQVFLETDARELHTHPVISQARYHRVIFNFPLADRHNIKLNRALLADFFCSCSQILADDGQVMVTLCIGQGGTPADQPMRSWHDSWQVNAMATNSGLILSQVVPFDALDYPQYHSVGFRFQDKSFNTDGALTHIFEKADMAVTPDTVIARGVVEQGSHVYTCSRYVADKLTRNLLEETNHPLSLLRHQLEESFRTHLKAEVVPDRDSWRVLTGHKSHVCTRPHDLVREHVNTEGFNDGDGKLHELLDSLKTAKERKNEANLNILKNVKKASFIHGVDTESGLEKGLRQNNHSSSCVGKQELFRFVPDNPESVCILIERETRAAAYSWGPCCEGQVGSTTDHGVDESCHLTTPGADKPGDLEEFDAQIHSPRSDVQKATTPCLSGDGEYTDTSDHLGLCCTGRVCHWRSSLLENLTDVCQCVYGSGQCPANVRASSPNMAEVYDRELTGGQCYVVSGQCCLLGAITPDTLAVQHQMMIVQMVSHGVEPRPHTNRSASDTHPATRNGISNHTTQQNTSHQFDDYNNLTLTSKSLTSALKSSISVVLSGLCSETAISVEDIDIHQAVTFTGFENVANVQMIYLQPKTKKMGEVSRPQVAAGLMFEADYDGKKLLVAACHLDNIVCYVCDIQDPRILWSQSQRFTEQFQPSFPSQFKLLLLYPMTFTHDLSFWQKDSDSEFDILEMYNIILYTAGDLVYSVALHDLYTDPNTGRVSRCYRLQFRSLDLAFPYLVSWKLQSLIRLEVTQRMGVTLR